jgi:hypothetical protein
MSDTATPVHTGRVIHIKDVPARVEGSHLVNFQLTETPRGDYVVTLWAKGKRTEYRELLSELAQIIEARHARRVAEAQGIKVPRPRR